jgi:hypothetical protein
MLLWSDAGAVLLFAKERRHCRHSPPLSQVRAFSRGFEKRHRRHEGDML